MQVKRLICSVEAGLTLHNLAHKGHPRSTFGTRLTAIIPLLA